MKRMPGANIKLQSWYLWWVYITLRSELKFTHSIVYTHYFVTQIPENTCKLLDIDYILKCSTHCILCILKKVERNTWMTKFRYQIIENRELVTLTAIFTHNVKEDESKDAKSNLICMISWFNGLEILYSLFTVSNFTPIKWWKVKKKKHYWIEVK